jgi:hypothetical protein
MCFQMQCLPLHLGGDDVPHDGAYPPVLGDNAAMMTVMERLSDSNAAVRAAAANIMRHAASRGAGAAASAALLAAGAPERVSRLLLTSQRRLQGSGLPDIIDQLSVALLRMATQTRSDAAKTTDDDATVSTTDVDLDDPTTLTRSIVECDDEKLAEGLAMCAAFAAHDGLSSAVLASGFTPPMVWCWGGNEHEHEHVTLQPLINFLTQTTDDGHFSAAAAAAPWLVHLSVGARVGLIGAGAGAALVSSLGLPEMASAFAEELGRILADGRQVPGERIAYTRWLTEQIVLAATSVMTDAAADSMENGTGRSHAAQSRDVIGTAATVGPLGKAMSTISLLIPYIDAGFKRGTAADEAIAALAVEGLASLARASFALLATAIRLGCTSAVLRRAVFSAQLRNAGQPELSSAARALLEAPVEYTTRATVTTAGRPFVPRGGYSLLTVEYLCDLLRASGGADHCEHPVINEDQVKSLLACILEKGDVLDTPPRLDTLGAAPNNEVSNSAEMRRCLQLATLKAVSFLSQAPHNHAALTEGDTPGALVDLSTDEATHVDVRLASLSALDEMLGGGGMLSWRGESTYSGGLDNAQDDDRLVADADADAQDAVGEDDDWRNASIPAADPPLRNNDNSLEHALHEEDSVRRACLMRILAASAGQLSAYDPTFISGLWLPPSEQLELGAQLSLMAKPDAETAALFRALYLRVVKDALAERAGESMTVAEALTSPSTWPRELVPLLSRHGLCRLISPAVRALSPGTLAVLVGMGGLKPLVAALGPAIAPLLGAILEAAGGSLWARMGQPMGSTDGPRLVEVASELAAMYRRHPDPAGIVGSASQVGRVALTPGCQIGYTNHTGRRLLNRVLTAK